MELSDTSLESYFGGKDMTNLFNIGTKVTINHNAERLLEEMLTVDSYVKVGILEKPDSQGSKSTDNKLYRNSKGRKQESTSVTVGEVGYAHEFGIGNLPQRSFLRSTYQEQIKNLSTIIKRLAKVEAAKNIPNIKGLLNLVGVYMVGRVKKKFTNNDWPPLQDPTRGGRNKSGNAKPLIDTNQLRGSITYQVIEKPRGRLFL